MQKLLVCIQKLVDFCHYIFIDRQKLSNAIENVVHWLTESCTVIGWRHCYNTETDLADYNVDKFKKNSLYEEQTNLWDPADKKLSK